MLPTHERDFDGHDMLNNVTSPTRWIGLTALALLGWGGAAAYALDSELLLRLDVLDPSLNALAQTYRPLWLLLSASTLLGAFGWAWRTGAQRLPMAMIVPLMGAILAVVTVFAVGPLGMTHSYAALHDPARQPVADANVAPDDWVVSLEHDGVEVIYPLDLLERHLAINDRVGGEPVLVTWCFSCKSPMAYRPTASHRTLSFDVVGIHDIDAILEDRETRSWWDEGTGQAVGGPLEGETLERVPTMMVQWRQWQGDPDTAQIAVRPDESIDMAMSERD